MNDADPLVHAIAHAAHALPNQGPIGVFIHHNTLHAFQHLPFHDGVQQGAALLGARPYLELGEFRELFRRGRIAPEDLTAEIAYALGDDAAAELRCGIRRDALWRALLVAPVDVADEPGTRFLLRSDTAFVDRARFEAAQARMAGGSFATDPRPEPRCHRDVLSALGDSDVDLPVNAELVRLCAGFLDQGQARWPLPGRERGFLAAVASLYADGGADPAGCPGVVDDFRQIVAEGSPALKVVAERLAALGVAPEHTESFITATLLALPGWAGMFARLEHNPGESVQGVAPRLEEFLAVRLVLQHRATVRDCAHMGLPLAWDALRARMPPPQASPFQSAWLLAALAREVGWSAERLATLDAATLDELGAEIRRCSSLWRRRVWHEAYERWYRRQVLDSLAARRALGSPVEVDRPEAQFVFCIDEREESIRRALEEQSPRFETFGAAGFFGVAIDYQGLDDAHAAPYCPPVVTPGHSVREAHLDDHAGVHERRKSWRQTIHGLEQSLSAASHTLLGGAFVSVFGGPLAGAAAASRVVAPTPSLLVAERFRALTPRPGTALSGLRQPDQVYDHGTPTGFTIDEAADRVAALLRNLGATKRLAPAVVVLGHGSTSLNNPHESAHDCGACGGRRGGANARLVALLANDAGVREALVRRGIAIPDTTWFVGGLHDTANDAVDLYDLDSAPPAMTAPGGAIHKACAALDVARAVSAAERCRRFEDAPLGVSPSAALAHVEERASQLGQPRPEYGHCTNAMCVVGRRSTTRGLHLDRRSFLVSYDPTTDPDTTILERILAAVGPVGAGISLEYYFSSVDNAVFGCGTKLPHNVTGLLGVMNGHQGDLRTGLPLQMVEIHEPMRLLLVVDATPATLLAIAGRQAEVRELVVNRWVQLIAMDPETGVMDEFRDGAFHRYTPAPVELPRVTRSAERHTVREHLSPALVSTALEVSL